MKYLFSHLARKIPACDYQILKTIQIACIFTLSLYKTGQNEVYFTWEGLDEIT